MVKLTIFTPTYNRGYTLKRLYDSLARQSDMRFEWLIIDDGSSDNTEILIKSLIEITNKFKIRYFKQDHKGKPSAQNLAIDFSEGEYFVTCDSNKYMDDNAVEKILYMVETIKDLPMMCGVGGYRADFSGKIYGGEMLLAGAKFIDCTNIERDKFHLSGDKSTIFRTEILKKYKSPIFPGETFITEAVWLLPMALDGYKIRWFPEVICYGEYTKDGLTMQGANSYIGHYKNFRGYLAYLKIAIKAYGFEKSTDMVIEALNIAREKKISFKEIGGEIDCKTSQLRKLFIKNIILNIYFLLPISKQGIKKMIGDNAFEKIKCFIKRKSF